MADTTLTSNSSNESDYERMARLIMDSKRPKTLPTSKPDVLAYLDELFSGDTTSLEVRTAEWRGVRQYITDLEQRGSHETCEPREAALQRAIDRHVRWRETALTFLRQVIDGRGTEDEWPALAKFIERSDSRMVESTSQKAEVCGRCRGSGRVPSPGGVEGEYCACGRCGGSGHAKSEGDPR